MTEGAGSKLEKALINAHENPGEESNKLVQEALKELEVKSADPAFREQVTRELNDGNNDVLKGFVLVDDGQQGTLTLIGKDKQGNASACIFSEDGRLDPFGGAPDYTHLKAAQEGAGDGQEEGSAGDGSEGQPDGSGDGQQGGTDGQGTADGGKDEAAEWGSPPRPFTAKADGTADTTVVKGDTMWGVARKLCEERAKADGHKLTAKEIRQELQSLIAANPEISNPNLIHAGDVIKIPAESVKTLNEAQAAAQTPEVAEAA